MEGELQSIVHVLDKDHRCIRLFIATACGDSLLVSIGLKVHRWVSMLFENT